MIDQNNEKTRSVWKQFLGVIILSFTDVPLNPTFCITVTILFIIFQPRLRKTSDFWKSAVSQTSENQMRHYDLKQNSGVEGGIYFYFLRESDLRCVWSMDDCAGFVCRKYFHRKLWESLRCWFLWSPEGGFVVYTLLAELSRVIENLARGGVMTSRKLWRWIWAPV